MRAVFVEKGAGDRILRFSTKSLQSQKIVQILYIPEFPYYYS